MKPARMVQVLADLLLGYATYALLMLVLKESAHGDICPPIAGIPACYILFGVVVLGWIGRFAAKLRPLYWLGITLPAVVALLASIGELANLVECPRSAGGTPMCFLSLGLFSTMFALALAARLLRRTSGVRVD